MERTSGSNRSGRSVWLIAIVIPMLLLSLAYGTALVLGVAELKAFSVTPTGAADWIANLVISFLVGSVFILGEEIGWRGYLLPRIQQPASKRRAAVVTGLLHGCFHLPLILIATTYDEHGSRWIVAPAAVITIAAGGVFYAYLRDRSGSVWPVAIAHNAANTHVQHRCRCRRGELGRRPGLRGRRERPRDARELSSWWRGSCSPRRRSGATTVQVDAATPELASA